MYPVELEIKDTTESTTSASYMDLHLSIGRDGQFPTYDKRNDFNFQFTNFPFLSSNIPASPAYGVFISQLIRYARACSSYGCFILRATPLSNKLLDQGYVKARLKSSLRKFYVRYRDLIKQYGHPTTDQTIPNRGRITKLGILPNFQGFRIEHLRRVWHADRGRLLLRTPGPVPFWTCIMFYLLRPILSRTFRYFFRLYTSNIPRYFLDFAYRSKNKSTTA